MSDVAGCAPPPPPHPPPTGGWGGGAPPPRWGWVANPDQKEGGGRDTRIGMTANTPSPRLRLTLFDLDHTLLPIDSDHAWGAFTTRIGWTDPAEFERRNDAFYADYQAGTLDVHDYVRFATAALRRHGPGAAAVAPGPFMSEGLRTAHTPHPPPRVQRHHRAGDEVLIVTATNDFVTRPIALALGVGADGLLATQLARDASGWYSGEVDGWPCSWRATPAAGTAARSTAGPACARANCGAWNNGWPPGNWPGRMSKAAATAI